MCVVVGWHLTAGRARLARWLGRWLTVAGVLAVGWYCWGFRHIPAPLQQVAAAVVRWLKDIGRVEYPAVWTGAVYVAAYLALWLLAPVWRGVLTAAITPLLWWRSTVRFTATTVTVGPFYHRRRINRREADAHGLKSIAFQLKPDPRLDDRMAAPQSSSAAASAAFLRQTQFLFVQHGPVQVPVTSFGTKRDAERFAQVCQFSLAYPLNVLIFRPAAGKQNQKPTLKRRNV